ncbi:hypothetical protein [Desulfobotulus sp.]|uniref:hypothetical protein n=1 Tax=Desulfobotulus sp. TaxID=1940337 RepID=UPI002A36BB52|nr:hypothetical protein [Desulfobotulus sp.]MDY0161921.1 hypothetical protein [Desulfobotulus sp.]
MSEGIRKLLTGLLGFWILVAFILPWLKSLPVIQPVMEIISAADIDANQYFYTQSEETFMAQSYVRDSLQRAAK